MWDLAAQDKDVTGIRGQMGAHRTKRTYGILRPRGRMALGRINRIGG
jgi:hypothetical protein